jgi:hypothetical protein
MMSKDCLECQINYEDAVRKLDGYRFDFNTAVRDKSEEAIQILLRKHADYGSKNISQSPGGAMNGLRVRLWDKIARLNNLVDSGVEPENESLYDTFLDICNYGLIGMLIIDDMWDKED